MIYGCYEQQRFESWFVKHRHNITEDGSVYVVGDGSIVMKVAKPSRNLPYGRVTIIGENGKNCLGEPFVYEDYFLPEELLPDNAQTL